jgi:hypothetical protein
LFPLERERVQEGLRTSGSVIRLGGYTDRRLISACLVVSVQSAVNDVLGEKGHKTIFWRGVQNTAYVPAVLYQDKSRLAA